VLSCSANELSQTIIRIISNPEDQDREILMKVSTSGLYLPHDINILNDWYKIYEKIEFKFSQETKKRYSKIRYITEARGVIKRLHKQIARLELPTHECVHSYREGMSSVTAILPHIRRGAIQIIDIKDFFPSITRTMIEYLYYYRFTSPDITDGDNISRIISTLCSMKDPRGINTTDAVLPIGIEPSSKISNAILYPVDTTITNICREYGLIYTRYSDNIMISSQSTDFPEAATEEIITAIEIPQHELCYHSLICCI